MAITTFYAALLAILYIWLSVRVISVRREERIEIGTGDGGNLLRRIRVHANFAEYAPFALLLMALAESVKAPGAAIHLAGLFLIAGRIVHAYGFSHRILRLRVAGMAMTFTAIAMSALAGFVYAGIQLVV